MESWRVAGFTELRELGAGAQGRVVLARHDASGRLVAIKYVSGDLGGFRAEAQTLRRVASPHVARLYDLVEQPGVGAAIVMEAVDGVSLKALLAERGPLTPEAALALLKGSLLGLEAAHVVGVVHRDYKPANVIVEGERSSKLIDFGIASVVGSRSRSGTPAYMAPEQWHGEPATPATDVYAATCVLVECLTGTRPYPDHDLRDAHLSGPVPVETVPEPLRDLVRHGMAKAAVDRPASAATFVSELEHAAVSGYGPGWEERGLTVLTSLAAALSALSPLAGLLASGSAAGAGATAAGAGTAGVGAGTTGGGAVGSAFSSTSAGGTAVSGTAAGGASGGQSAAAASQGLLAKTLASKAALSVAALVAVGTVGTVVAYTSTASSKPRRVAHVGYAITPITPRTDALGSGGALRITGEYAQVSGLLNPQLTARANAALRTPVDQRIGYDEPILRGFGDAQTYTAIDKATFLLRGPHLVSVRYDTDVQGQLGSGWDRVRTATVDLATGELLTLRRLLAASTTTASGLATLTQRINPYLRGGTICAGDTNPGNRILQPANLDDSSTLAALSPTTLDLFLDGPLLGFAEACGQQEADIPYSAIADLLNPQILARIPVATPRNTPPTP